MPEVLDAERLARALDALDGWSGDPTGIRRTVELPSFAAAIRLVNAVAADAEALDHHPDIDIRYATVTFTVSTHSAGGVTRLDLDLAEQVDRHAAEAVAGG